VRVYGVKDEAARRLMLEELESFIQSNPDPRELKRAVAVKMVLAGYKHHEIQAVLGVSSGFISKWSQMYPLLGVDGLRLAHQGSVGYLSAQQHQAVVDWLQSKAAWQLDELKAHLEQQYDVVYRSQQSYYALFAAAKISWKKTQKRNPKEDPVLVEKKTGNYGLARI
jgi:putative transposase